MDILGIQIFGLFFGLAALYWTFLHFKREEFTIKETFSWGVVWIVFILVILMPKSLEFVVTDIFSVSRTIDFFIIIGFMFLIAISYYNYSAIKRQQRKIEKLVREIAIRGNKIKKK